MVSAGLVGSSPEIIIKPSIRPVALGVKEAWTKKVSPGLTVPLVGLIEKSEFVRVIEEIVRSLPPAFETIPKVSETVFPTNVSVHNRNHRGNSHYHIIKIHSVSINIMMSKGDINILTRI